MNPRFAHSLPPLRFTIGLLLFALALFLAPAAQAADPVPTNRADYLSSSQYQSLGFNNVNDAASTLENPTAFSSTDTTNPLEGYTPTTLSELYVGQMNRYGSDYEYKGNFFVADNALNNDASSLNLDAMANNKIGNTTDFYDKRNNSDMHTQCKNVIAVKPGNLTDAEAATRKDVLVENTLYYTTDGSNASHQLLMVWSLNGQNQYQQGARTVNNLEGGDWVADIHTWSQQGLTAMAAGDYDQDGENEVAVYVPLNDKGGRIAIYDLVQDGTNWKLTDKGSSYYWTPYQSGKDRYGFADGVERPIVNLNTTSIAGHDDLVLCISMPYDDKHVGNAECDVLTIYNNGIHRKFYSGLYYKDSKGDAYRMVFPASVSADVNGDGQKELVVAGNRNTGYSNRSAGAIDSNNNLVNVLLWDGTNYAFAWSTPQSLHAITAVNEDIHNKNMNDPAALSAATYTPGSAKQTVFCEGALYDFSAAGGVSGNDAIKNGRFTCDISKDFKVSNDNDCYIAKAVSGSFVEGQRTSEQTVVLSGHVPNGMNDHVSMDITWYHQDGNGNLAQDRTNTNYVDTQNEDDDGTMIVLAAANLDDDTVNLKYTGKDVGFSDPAVYTVMLSAPYWSELNYGTSSTGRGSTSFSITSTAGKGKTDSWNVGGGLGISVNMTSKILGPVGGVSLDVSSSYLESYMDSTTTSKTLNFSAGAGDDYVGLIVTPVATYHYDMDIPDHKATQSDVDAYAEEHGGDTSGAPAIGSTVKRTTKEILATVQLTPTATTTTVDQYNRVIQAYNDTKPGDQKALPLIDVNSLCSGRVVGDPTTYPADLGATTADLGDDDTMTGDHTINVTTVKNVTTTATFNQAISFTRNHGYTVNGKISGSLGISFPAGANRNVSIVGTASVTGGGGKTWSSTTGWGQNYSGSLVTLPESANQSVDAGGNSRYAFTANLAKWASPLSNGQSIDSITYEGDDETSTTLDNKVQVIGYLVTGTNGSAPPALPQDLHAVTASDNAVLLEWTNPSGARKPGSYKVYRYDAAANTYHAIQTYDGKDLVVDSSQNHALVTGLDAGTAYSFVLEAWSGTGAAGINSVKGPIAAASTKADSSSKPVPVITEAPQDAYIAAGGSAAFTVQAHPQDSADTLTYQWQRLTLANSYQATWTDVLGQTTPTLTVAGNDAVNGSVYRCAITEKKTGINDNATIFTRSATLHVDQGTGASLSLTLPADANGDSLTSTSADGRSFSVITGKALSFSLSGTGLTAGDLKVGLINNSDNGNPTILSAVAKGDGTYTASLAQGLATGAYTAIAWYAPDGSEGYTTSAALDITALDDATPHAITYVLDGGANDNDNPTTFTQTSGIIPLKDAAREGADFAGWHRKADLSDAVVTQIDCSHESADITLYAAWKYTTYAITYELDGGVNARTNPSTYTLKDTVILGTPTKTGYTFGGWYEDSELTLPIYGIGPGVIGDKTCYAKWTAIPAADSDETIAMTTLTDPATGIRVTADMHPDAVLSVEKLGTGNSDYDALAQDAGSRLMGVYRLGVTCHNGAYVDYDGDFTISFPVSLFNGISQATIRERIGDLQNRYNVTFSDGYLTISTKALGTYAIVKSGDTPVPADAGSNGGATTALTPSGTTTLSTRNAATAVDGSPWNLLAAVLATGAAAALLILRHRHRED